MSIEKITIHFVDHNTQRYNTVGDWYYDGTENHVNGELVIMVSKSTNEVAGFMIAIHEMVEALLCRQAGITVEAVDNFDLHAANYSDNGEPGEIPSCPYYDQHQTAEIFERMLGQFMGLKWHDYENALDMLYLDYKDELEVEDEDDDEFLED